MDGANQYQGRVELCIDNKFTTICEVFGTWSVNEATVVCRQLNFTSPGSRSKSFLYTLEYSQAKDAMHFVVVH